jgi:hypothetical protein
LELTARHLRFDAFDSGVIEITVRNTSRTYPKTALQNSKYTSQFPETREYTTSVHVNDLPTNSIQGTQGSQGTRREYRPQQGPYQPPRSASYAGQRDGS